MNSVSFFFNKGYLRYIIFCYLNKFLLVSSGTIIYQVVIAEILNRSTTSLQFVQEEGHFLARFSSRDHGCYSRFRSLYSRILGFYSRITRWFREFAVHIWGFVVFTRGFLPSSCQPLIHNMRPINEFFKRIQCVSTLPLFSCRQTLPHRVMVHQQPHCRGETQDRAQPGGEHPGDFQRCQRQPQ